MYIQPQTPTPFIFSPSHTDLKLFFLQNQEWSGPMETLCFGGVRRKPICSYDHKPICTYPVHFTPIVLLFFYSFFLCFLHFTPGLLFLSFILLSSLNSFLSHMPGRDPSNWQDSIGLDSPWSIQLPCGCHVFMKDDDVITFFSSFFRRFLLACKSFITNKTKDRL